MPRHGDVCAHDGDDDDNNMTDYLTTLCMKVRVAVRMALVELQGYNFLYFMNVRLKWKAQHY